MNNEKLIEAVRRARKEEKRFFSSTAKPERERCVVRKFLANLSILVSEDELISLPQDDDGDVIFGEAHFQVKEITDADCRRSSEVLADLKRAESATRPEELFDIPVARNIIWVDAYPLICDEASSHLYPPKSRSKLDLLFYITRRHAFLDRSLQPADLSSLGWRSISCLFGRHSYVLVAASHAPSFLRDCYDGG